VLRSNSGTELADFSRYSDTIWSQTMTLEFDLVLTGGRLIDPATNTDASRDIGIRAGKIAAVADHLPSEKAKTCINVSGKIILPGMIDTHAHVFQHVSGRFGLNPDMVGVHSGATTVVDQGGASCMTFPGFRHFIAEPATTRVLSSISAYVVGGLEGHYYPDLYSPKGVDVGATIRTAEANRDLICGIKAHAEIGGFERWGIEVIRMSKEISRAVELPIYIHFGQLWPRPEQPSMEYAAEDILQEVVPLLDAGDVLAHPFTRHPGGFVNEDGEVHPIVHEALERGLTIDIGHGSHFSFDMARRVLDAGILPQTLGADMHGYNTAVPPPAGSPDEHPDEEMHAFGGDQAFSLTWAMSELLALGLELPEIVPMVTTNAAAMIGRKGKLGTLKIGSDADVSVLSQATGQFEFRDNGGGKAIGTTLLHPEFCLKAGETFKANAPILPRIAA
jgi:dihydroorotase